MAAVQNNSQDNPPDIHTLAAWLDRILAQHYANQIEAGEDVSPELQTQRKDVERTRAVLLGEVADAEALESVRRLLAIGLMSWRRPSDPPAELRLIVIQEVATSTLWPLVITRKLPKDWQSALREISSTELVRLIQDLRQQSSKKSEQVLCQELANELLDPQYAIGIGSLLEDLRDEHRGGSVIVSLAVVRDGQRPPATGSLPQWLYWVLGTYVGGSALQGIIGNRSDALVVKLWEEWQSSSKAVDTGKEAIQRATDISSLSPLARGTDAIRSVSILERLLPIVQAIQNAPALQKATGAAVTGLLILLGIGGARQFAVGIRQPTPTAIVSAPTAPVTPTFTATLTPTASPTETPTSEPTTTPTSEPTTTPTSEPTATITPSPRPTIVRRVQSTIPSSPYDQLEREMVDLLNAQRRANGCNVPLDRVSELTISARKHSEDMASHNFFDAIGTDGSNRLTRANAAGYVGKPGTRVRENLAAGDLRFFSAQSHIDTWMADPNVPFSHRYQILDCSYNEVGVGFAHNDASEYKDYWTVAFGVGIQ